MSKYKLTIYMMVLLFFLTGCGRVTSASGSNADISDSANSESPVITNISIFPNNIIAPYDVSFTAMVTDLDTPSANLRYIWDFGDGATDNATAPTHRYTYRGEFYVTLIVYDDEDNFDVKINEIPVKVIGGNQKPIISICQADRITVNIGETISFSSLATDPDLDTLTYGWDFGDGSGSDQQNDTHYYAENGVYTVKLSVADDKGAVTSEEILIGVGPNIKLPPVINSVDWDPFFPLDNSAVSFSAQAVDYDGSIISYLWEFGDGGTSTQISPQYIYTKAGNYQVKLTVQDTQGLTDVMQKYIVIGIGE